MPPTTSLTDLLIGGLCVLALGMYLAVIHRKEAFVARWATVGSVSNLPALRSMYVWLFIVPIAARVLDSVKSPFTVPGTEGALQLNLQLPFSWQVFFFAALAASLANLVFFYACPDLVRRFVTYAAFQQEGRDLAFLLAYAKSAQVAVDEFRIDSHNTHSEIGRTQVQQLFWQLYDHENKKRPLLRAVCLGFQGIALWGMAVVMWQNIAFVYQRIELAKLFGAA